MKNDKKRILVVLAAAIAISGVAVAENQKRKQELPFEVYRDKGTHFSPSGYMGDYGDVEIVSNWSTNPGKGEQCIKVTYAGKGLQGSNWAGVYWQDPEGNWGAINGAGYNLTGAKKIKFLARGESGAEVVEFKAGGIAGKFPDSFRADGVIINLTPKWQEYEIDLTGNDLSTVVGGFLFTVSKTKNPAGCVFYLDEIRYE
jgi:hypothetical protein